MPFMPNLINFYKFFKLTHIKNLQNELEVFCKQKKLLGTIILAEEGINAMLAGEPDSIEDFLKFIRQRLNMPNLNYNASVCTVIPFRKLKVLHKKEIVTFDMPDADPSQKTGCVVQPEHWNQLISDPDVLLIDTRNEYEVSQGTFQKALNPKTASFKEFARFSQEKLASHKHKKIAMFCTGGIRCEKASSYLLGQGFKEVYQLQGGILNYLKTVEEKESLWLGKCFVFDDRIAV